MDYIEHDKLSSELYDLVWMIYFKLQSLKGYCGNVDNEMIQSVMIVTLLEDIIKDQQNLKRNLDSYCTKIGNSLVEDCYRE